MRYVIIVGAGPIGLYTAIMLKQLGVEHVQVIDPRARHYTRPGAINPNVFKNLETHLNRQEYELHPMVPESEMKKGYLYVEKGEAEDSLKYSVKDFYGETQTGIITPDDIPDLEGSMSDSLDMTLLQILKDDILDVTDARNHTFISIMHSNTPHIKDVERALYDIAIKMGVTISTHQFEDFKNKQMVVSDEERSISYMPCDLAIDATGHKRALIVNINRKTDNHAFNIERVFDNPIKNYFIAYGKIAADDIALIVKANKNKSLKNDQILAHTLNLEYLRSEFGWREFDDPKLHIIPVGKGKACIYFEMPPGLDEDKHEAWMNAFLLLKTGKHIDFERTSPDKPTYNEFIVNPLKVTTALYDGDEDTPCVWLVGDAQIDPHFEEGIGISSGMERTDAFLRSITLDRGDILAIDREQYALQLREQLFNHEARLIKAYSQREKELMAALIIEKNRYTQALSYEISDSHSEIIARGLSEINLRLARDLIQRQDLATNLLYDAVRFAKQSVVSTLIENGTFINKIYNENGLTVLHMAITDSNVDLTQYLLDNGADTDYKYNGRQALHHAILGANEDIVRMLLDRQVDANQQDDYGITPLCLAVKSGLISIIHLLLDHKADVNLPMRNGMTPLYLAVSMGLLNIAQLLVEQGANVHDQGIEGSESLVRLAIINSLGSDTEMLDFLLHASEHKIANFTEKVSNLLAMAEEQGCRNEIEALLKANYQDPLPENIHNFSALEYAVFTGHTDVIETLLKGAAVSRQCVANAIDYALAMKNEAVVSQLKLFQQLKSWGRLFSDKTSMSEPTVITSGSINKIKGDM